MRKFDNNKMRARRVELGMSQEDVANEVRKISNDTKLSVYTISRIESGANQGMHLDTLIMIAKVLQLDPEELLREEDSGEGGKE